MLTYTGAKAEDFEPLFLRNKQLIDEYEDLSAIDYGRVLSGVHRNLEWNLPAFTRILWDDTLAGYQGIGSAVLIRNTHALMQCNTIQERLRCMGIDLHPHRLPRKGRDAGICFQFSCECGAFTGNL